MIPSASPRDKRLLAISLSLSQPGDGFPTDTGALPVDAPRLKKHGQQKSKWNLEHTPPGCRHARWFCCRVACSAAGTETCHILVLPVSNHCHVTAATITSDRKICPPPPSGCPEGACWDCSHVSHNMAQPTGSPSSLPYESLWPMTNQKPTLSVAAVLALHGFAEL